MSLLKISCRIFLIEVTIQKSLYIPSLSEDYCKSASLLIRQNKLCTIIVVIFLLIVGFGISVFFWSIFVSFPYIDGTNLVL